MPNSITSIGYRAFGSCSSINNFIIPNGVTFIDDYAFAYCTSLSSVTIPDSVTRIDSGAFDGCSNLASVYFLGNAPTLGSYYVFGRNNYYNPYLTIYFFNGSAGFSYPSWYGYKTMMISESSYPAAKWLLENGLDYDIELGQYVTEEGTSLLLAYALNLDPRQQLSGKMPKSVIVANEMEMTFYAKAQGVSYTVEASKDLLNWTTEIVSLSSLNAEGYRTASVDRDATQCFLRLVVQKQ